MIEIVFGDSACGSLNAALLYGKGNCIGCGHHVFGIHPDGSELTQEEIKTLEREAEEWERLAWEKAKPIDGDPADVYGFFLVLSVGDISEDIPGEKRQQVLNWLWSIYPDIDGEDITIGVDSWVAQRIEEMIRSGLLVPVSEAKKDEPVYNRFLKKYSNFQ